VSRGDRTIFSQLNFEVAPGEILHVQGRNGAGKTTLLETLGGLRVPAAGTIEGGPQTAQRHWLGHRSGLNAALTPVENLQFWCALNGAPDDQILPALEQLGVKTQRHRLCGALSTGQRRRAALARLLVARRPWWFLDEPLAGVDAAGVQVIVDLLGAHARAGGAAVVTSHQALPGNLPNLRVLALAI
ncbi:MAG: ccmA, partial [Nevskia sp.]|nr:ccmA [Nevskia sp.]